MTEIATDPAPPEPPGLWAIVAYTPQGEERPDYLVKAPGFYDKAYWYPLGTEDGWGWDQVTRWPGTVNVVRDGVPD